MKKLLTLFISFFIAFIFISVFPFSLTYADDAASPDDKEEYLIEESSLDQIKDSRKLTEAPNMTEYHVRNPGNLPFIHDEKYAKMDITQNNYGTIKNDSGYFAFGKAIEFSIKSLIKLVGAMCLYGIFRGLVRLVVGHGEEEQYKKGIQSILWSFVGLILSLIAHAVVTALLQTLTGVGTLNV